MKKVKVILAFLLALSLSISLISCTKPDKNYGVESENKTVKDTNSLPNIMSSDKIMPNYFDISLFDEENYSDIYLGEKFKISAKFCNTKLSVPVKMNYLTENGWKLAQGSQYDATSLVYAKETVDAVFVNDNGASIKALFYNSSNSSVRLSNCNIVKFLITNDYYYNTKNYAQFDVNGINNRMAITDVIEKLGTPSHFYKVDNNNYYLDYFISEKDRRNGITVYINVAEDSVTAIEFSFYK